MAQYKVAEKFASINGEGQRAGQTAVFIRFAGCNLNCSYCDTSWANQKNTPFTPMTEQEIYKYIKSTGIKNVTLTGGEPLLQRNIALLLKKLSEDDFLSVEIETNGSVDISPYIVLPNRPVFTLDYKLPFSNMESAMLLSNYNYVNEKDTLKFVCGSVTDLEKAKYIIQTYKPQCKIYLSPVFGKIDPAQIVDFMIKNKMNNINLQLQLHKFIWNPNKRGV